MQYEMGTATAGLAAGERSKLLRNTYTMLALTLAVSAGAAALAVMVGIGQVASLVMSLVALGLVWFVLPRVANSGAGIWCVFAFTALLGASLGPMLSYYLAIPNGPGMVMQALGGTALVFFGLSGYVLATGKDFSFLGGFLMVGLLVAIFGMLGVFVAGMFGVNVSGVSLAISAVVVFLMSGFILYDTSRIVNGGETNYLMATVSLYLNIYNLFVHLLHLIGAFSGD